ncbi:MAG: CHASE2 domain-containing protein, partial [Deltaproteobacteria bacterium]|nr:CHASE2 domain-containing protein [Deltaproteobacteria bacterium]
MKQFFKSFVSLNPSSITTGIIILVLALFLIGIPIFELVELKSYDIRFTSRGVEKPSPEVVMAVIDEKSLDTEGRWPWPRSKMARLIDALSQDGAKVIGFDIFFTEPDKSSPLQLVNQLEQKIETFQIKNPQLKKFIDQSKIEADNDLALANAIKRSKAGVVLGYFFHMSQKELDYQIDQKEIENHLERISTSRYPLVIYEDQEMEIDPFPTAYAPESNIEILTRATESFGYVNTIPDLDGVVRSTPIIIKCGKEIFMPLAVRCMWHYLDEPQLMVKVAIYGIEGIQMGKTFIPTDEEGKLRINYLGPRKTFPHHSIGDILHGKLPKGTFKNKIVIVGATATGIYDMRNTPFDPVYPGLEIHATVADNILQNSFLHKPKWTVIYDILAIVMLGVLIGIVLPRLNALYGILFAAGLFVLHIYMGRLLFIHTGLLVNIVYPLLAIILAYTGLTLYHYLVEEKNKRFLHATFTSYLSPELIEEMVSSETMPELGGETRIV